MQQVVDLQNSKEFQSLGVELLSVASDPVEAWRSEGAKLSITLPLLSDQGAKVAREYGVMRWRMGSEPGHTFILVDKTGRVVWVRDYGSPEHGGLMYVAPAVLVPAIRAHLNGPAP